MVGSRTWPRNGPGRIGRAQWSRIPTEDARHWANNGLRDRQDQWRDVFRELAQAQNTESREVQPLLWTCAGGADEVAACDRLAPHGPWERAVAAPDKHSRRHTLWMEL
jgi:hypothetical protein